MPAHHDVRAEDIDLGRLGKTLAAVADRGPEDFAELMLVPGVGARTLFALALVAEVVHGAPVRFGDPARFSLAHGGKDGHPFPVPLAVYDETIGVLKRAVERAKLGEGERLAAIKRLDDQARRLDAATVTPEELDRGVAAEWRAKAALGGRTVADDRRRAPAWKPPPASVSRSSGSGGPRQLRPVAGRAEAERVDVDHVRTAGHRDPDPVVEAQLVDRRAARAPVRGQFQVDRAGFRRAGSPARRRCRCRRYAGCPWGRYYRRRSWRRSRRPSRSRSARRRTTYRTARATGCSPGSRPDKRPIRASGSRCRPRRHRPSGAGARRSRLTNVPEVALLLLERSGEIAPVVRERCVGHITGRAVGTAASDRGQRADDDCHEQAAHEVECATAGAARDKKMAHRGCTIGRCEIYA
jgi:hypothetical protein